MKESVLQPLADFRALVPPSVGTLMTVEQAMRLAISEAYKGATRVSPNPLVGCVILDQHSRFLSAGYHAAYGGNHAEVEALAQVKATDLIGAHLICTLEPCAHEGKTPSCAKTIAKLPLAKVTYGLIDPNPLVAGQGVQIIRDAGIHVDEFKNYRDELEEVCEAFLKNFREKKVFVHAKVAATLDGMTAEVSGRSQWITNSDSRLYSHYLRACTDAVVVGVKTLLADNPSLNVRHPEITKKNKVVILDTRGECLVELAKLNVVKFHQANDLFVFVSEKYRAKVEAALEKELKLAQVYFIEASIETSSEGLNLAVCFEKMWELGLRSVFVESGGKLLAKLFENNLIDRFHFFQSLQIMGPGLSWSKDLPQGSLDSPLKMKRPRFMCFGTDLYLTSRMN